MMKDANVEQAIAHPGVMIASDGVPFVNGTGHPRGAGTYARVLGLYVREKHTLPSDGRAGEDDDSPGPPARVLRAGDEDKGRLAVGADADITVFDPPP